jgi:hypothetical protein
MSPYIDLYIEVIPNNMSPCQPQARLMEMLFLLESERRAWAVT